MEPAVSRIIDRTHTWADKGWQTATAATPYINWRYREYNKTADKVCNTIMDNNKDIHTNIPTPPPTDPHTHIFAQSDGGCRHTGTSSTGYAIKTHNSNTNTTTLITTGGTIINSNLSSLTVETIALDLLTERITDWMNNNTQRTNNTPTTPNPL